MIKNLLINSTKWNPAYTPNNNNVPLSYGNLSYTIDWSFLEEHKDYKVTFSFVSKEIVDIMAENLYLINLPLTATAEVYEAGNGIYKKQTNIIGVIHPAVIDAPNGRLHAMSQDNPPFTIRGRPSNQVVNVNIQTLAGATYNLLNDYVLILSFEEVR